MYIELLRKILQGENPGHGKNGYYLASPGSIAVSLSIHQKREMDCKMTYDRTRQWDDLYAAMATALLRRGVITDDAVVMADDEGLEAMGAGLGCPAALVPLMLGGK